MSAFRHCFLRWLVVLCWTSTTMTTTLAFVLPLGNTKAPNAGALIETKRKLFQKFEDFVRTIPPSQRTARVLYASGQDDTTATVNRTDDANISLSTSYNTEYFKGDNRTSDKSLVQRLAIVVTSKLGQNRTLQGTLEDDNDNDDNDNDTPKEFVVGAFDNSLPALESFSVDSAESVLDILNNATQDFDAGVNTTLKPQADTATSTETKSSTPFFPTPKSTLGTEPGMISEDDMLLNPESPFSDDSTMKDTKEEPDSTMKNIKKESETGFGWLVEDSAQISHSFYPKTFRPAWFAKNNHFQTILANQVRESVMYFPNTGTRVLSRFKYDTRQRVHTPDGDFFDVDWKYTKYPHTATTATTSVMNNHSSMPQNATGTPIVLVCHGLQSSSDSPLAKDLAIAFNEIGMDVGVINFRGCGGEKNVLPMGYHLSFTDDLAYMIEQVHQTHPHSPIYLSGFSLGANVVTRYLADQGGHAYTKYNVWGGAAHAVPMDLTKCRSLSDVNSFSGAVYGTVLAKSLKQRILDEYDEKEYSFPREELEAIERCIDFDDLVVCSAFDFEDADDYHQKSSNAYRLDNIQVPHYILQSEDDPFFEGDDTVIPQDPSKACRVHYSKYGGHCAFAFHTEEADKRLSSFMPTEMARFLHHIHETKLGQRTTEVALRRPPPLPPSKPIDEIDAAGLLTGPVSQQRSFQQEYRRKKAAMVSHSFATREFKPNWWATNSHIQTICGGLFRKGVMYTNRTELPFPWSWALATDSDGENEDPLAFWDERQRMETPDGDFFDVDWKYVHEGYNPGNPIVLICHGLQSDSRSPLAQDLAGAFGAVGMDVGCINFRGCSGEINRTPVGYHVGFTDDLRQTVLHLNKKFPNRSIYLSGFSLGANVVTTFLANLGDTAYDYNIRGAAVNAIPFDMPECYKNLNEPGLTKSIYGDRLLKSMVDRVEDSYETVAFPFPREEARKCRTIKDMENLVICPVFGFKDAYDYYDRTNMVNRIDEIAVPQFALQAKDDPFLFGQELPNIDGTSRPFRIHATPYGGHCGYVFHSQREKEGTTEHSWMPTELARFLAHLERNFVLGSDGESDSILETGSDFE